MNIKDFYPMKGFYQPNQELTFGIDFAQKTSTIEVQITIFAINQEVFKATICQDFKNDTKTEIAINSPFPKGGYSIQLKDLQTNQICLSAFDIQSDWTEFPRYGFLSQFSPEMTQQEIENQLATMAKYHINGIQFYDWQYRHDNLIPPTTEFLDPLNRALSMQTINNMIHTAHQKNMIAMPYLAIYGASIDFWREHPEWGLYDEQGNPLLFEDFLGLMDPTQGTPWCVHLENECQKVLEKTKFDGLHIDQYGDPKQAWTKEGKEINIPQSFVDFINKQKKKLKVPVIFNAVGNWPIEELAKSDADFIYIEIWEPTPKFTNLQEIVENARTLSGNKPVVIPIYIHEKDWTNVLLADAVIAASGGTHLELGDGAMLLSDPYFPKSEKLSSKQMQKLRNFWDFLIAYQFILGPQATNINQKIEITSHENIHTITRQRNNWKAINLIQLNQDDKWTEPQIEKETLSEITLEIRLENKIKNLYFTSPDHNNWILTPLAFQLQDGILTCSIPSLTHWSMLLIEHEN